MDSKHPAHSPDGLYHIEWSMFEARMSHWICSPKVVHAATGQVIFDFIGSNWDASFRWLDTGRFNVYLREYPAGAGIDVWVDPPNGVFRIAAENATAEPLSEFRMRVTSDVAKDGSAGLAAQIKTCPHLHPIERAIEEAIAASVGRFEARGFSVQGPDPRIWGSPGPTWRCYSCGGGEAPCYLDTSSLLSSAFGRRRL